MVNGKVLKSNGFHYKIILKELTVMMKQLKYYGKCEMRQNAILSICNYILMWGRWESSNLKGNIRQKIML